MSPPPRSFEDLARALQRIDGRGYKAYKDLRGVYHRTDRPAGRSGTDAANQIQSLTLAIDHVQGDPFAAPSKLRLRVGWDDAGWPRALAAGRVRRLALADFLAREVDSTLRAMGSMRRDERAPEDAPRSARHGRTQRARLGGGSGRSGVVSIDVGGQEVLERSAIRLGDDFVEARIELGLPASGRRVLGREAEALLLEMLPRLAERSLVSDEAARERARRFVECIENQEQLRDTLRERGWLAFVGDGAILPRESGASQRPLAADRAVPFRAPDAFAHVVTLPNPIDGERDGPHELRGMALPEGVTLIVGGGYHGKSTLLQALERGVHPQVPGDGREHVVSRAALVKVRAEDGRRVEGVDIQPFIDRLPTANPDRPAQSTHAFRSDDASGSTSQAASIIEAIEAGACGLLLDEDSCATNFMLRDARMQALVQREHEPITPFLDRVRELYERHGVSTVLVMGGCGDYFDVADRVILLRDYAAYDGSERAREIAAAQPTGRSPETPSPWQQATPRVPLRESFDASRGRSEVKIDVQGPDRLRFGEHEIDLRGVEPLCGPSQLRAIGHAIHAASQHFVDDERTLPALLDALEQRFDDEGLDWLDPFHRPDQHPGAFARPRRFDIAAAINRLRTLRTRPAR